MLHLVLLVVDHYRDDRVGCVPEHGGLLGRHPALLGALGQDARRRRRAPRRLHLPEVSRMHFACAIV